MEEKKRILRSSTRLSRQADELLKKASALSNSANVAYMEQVKSKRGKSKESAKVASTSPRNKAKKRARNDSDSSSSSSKQLVAETNPVKNSSSLSANLKLEESRTEKTLKNVVVEKKVTGSEGEKHPAINKEVLAKLFQLYPPNYLELRNIRLVCKSWHDASLERWRNAAVLKLVPENTVFRNTENGGLKPTELLSRLEDPQDPYQLNSKPYSRFQFDGLKLDMSIRNKGLSRRFWQLVGPSMSYLHLNKCEFIEVSTKPFESLVLEKTPKLKEIVVADTGMVEQPYGPEPTVDLKKRHNLNVLKVTVRGGIPLKLADLLIMFPNMKELTLRNGQHAKYSSSVITLLNNLRRDSRFKKYKLEKLDIKGTYIINNSIINPFMGPVSERWNQLRCNLKTLCLELTPLERADSIFQPLLQANKNVETLELCIVPRYPATVYHGADRFQFRTTMESLTDLRLWGNTIQNFKFLRFLPNLKRLYCNPLCFEKWCGKGKHHQPCTKDLVKNTRLGMPFTSNFMEHLHVDHELSTICIKKLTEWMPNLKVLKTILNSQTFPLVCQGWSNLKELRLLFGSSVHDDVIIGGSAPMPKTAKRKKQNGSSAGVVNLKHLNVFTLDAYCNEAKLADVAVQNGFLKMPSLVTLKICVSEQMSTEAETLLKQQIPCVRVIRNHGPGPHDDYECCLRKRFIVRVNAGDDEDENVEAEVISDDDSDNDDEDDDANNEFMSDSDDEVGIDAGDNHHPLPPLPAFLPVLFAFQQIVGGPGGDGNGADGAEYV